MSVLDITFVRVVVKPFARGGAKRNVKIFERLSITRTAKYIAPSRSITCNKVPLHGRATSKDLLRVKRNTTPSKSNVAPHGPIRWYPCCSVRDRLHVDKDAVVNLASSPEVLLVRIDQPLTAIQRICPHE